MATSAEQRRMARDAETRQNYAAADRVCRGGAFGEYAARCRSAQRARMPASVRDRSIGFRPALDREPEDE